MFIYVWRFPEFFGNEAAFKHKFQKIRMKVTFVHNINNIWNKFMLFMFHKSFKQVKNTHPEFNIHVTQRSNQCALVAQKSDVARR